MTDIPEVRAAKALQHAVKLGERRRALTVELEQVNAELREACAEAARAGASRRRISQLVGVSRPSLYEWLKNAGVDAR